MAEASGSSSGSVSNQLASLVPSFDPAVDDLLVYQQKVELVLAAWPKGRLTELITRLILNCKGTAFQKLQLHQTELLSGDEAAVHKLVEYLGGQWGKIALERQYEDAEQAIYHTQQRADESNDSFLARADILWSRLLARKITIADLQAYILLRGSQLSAEEKKKVIMDAETSGSLTVKKVTEAIRLLGASFFQEMTGKKQTRTKIYDQAVLMTETTADPTGEDDSGLLATEEATEAEFLETMIQEGDQDALLIADFESAAMETIQEDAELATALTAYQQARHKLAEKFRNRGFFPNRPFNKGKGSGYKASGKGKNNWGNRSRRSLQDRILNSTCRICHQVGHWKAECPLRHQGGDAPAAETNQVTTAPTTTVVTLGDADILPLEFLGLPEATIDEPKIILADSFVCESHQEEYPKYSYRGKILGEFQRNNYVADSVLTNGRTVKERLKHHVLRSSLSPVVSHRSSSERETTPVPDRSMLGSSFAEDANPVKTRCSMLQVEPVLKFLPEGKIQCTNQPIYFATHGAFGVLDLGASKTVIGSDHVANLIQNLDEDIRSQLSKCPCHVTFKFGNQGTLSSTQALVVPIGDLKLKIAIVPGGTPFLVSNTLMRAIRALIDCHSQRLGSPYMRESIPLELTPRGLFLINLNDLARAAVNTKLPCPSPSTKIVQETFVATESKEIQADHNAEQEQSSEVHANRTTSKQPNNVTCSEQPLPSITQTNDQCTVEAERQHPAQDHSIHHSLSGNAHSHVPVSSPEGHAARSGDSSCGLVSSDLGGSSRRKGELWSETSWPHVHGSLAGPVLGQLHGGQVLTEQGSGPSSSPEIHRIDGGQARRGSDANSRDATSGITGHIDRRPFWTQVHAAQGQSQVLRIDPSANSLRVRGRDGGVRDVCLRDYALSAAGTESGVCCNSGSHVASGECHDQSDSPSRRPSCEDRRGQEGMMPDPDMSDQVAVSLNTIHADVQDLHRLIEKFTLELEQCQSQTRHLGKPFQLGEIFCSSQSPVTQQIRNLGGQAFRFGLEQGDLATVPGRLKLFQQLCQHRPEHLWYSPVCGPWSSWSALNASRSLEHQREYQEQRHSLRYQIALGIIFYRHQISQGKHFHWEQPQRSLMLHHPGINEIHQHTQSCQFDMCEVGKLQDPVSGYPMKKGMQVLTTHGPLFKELHGKVCQRNHIHQPIEGSTRSKGETMLRTKFTEVYPRKFARLVAKVLNRTIKVWPFHWQPGMLCSSHVSFTEHADALANTARRRVMKPSRYRDSSSFERTQLSNPVEIHDHGVKRRRLDGKQSIGPTQSQCQEVLQNLDSLLPRVGRREVQDSEILKKLQEIFPDKQVVSAVACRGTNRTMGPPDSVNRQIAPFRRTLMIHRPSGAIKFETNWENWTELSNRQLIRPAHACRINITVFSRDHSKHVEPASSSQQGSVSSVPADNQTMSEPIAPRPEVDNSSVPVASPETNGDGNDHCQTDTTSTTRPVFDTERPEDPPSAVRAQQGPQFRALPKWEQNQLLQIHRNLGHPTNERLAKALRANGQRPEMVKAAMELKCSICAASSAPKHQRPGHLKPLLDFNHRVYMDGIKWTSKNGDSYQLYHILDAGTHYHVAFVAPSHTSRDVIQLMSQHWCNWAGAPQELKVDSGTELNSEEFAEFAQRFNIKCETTNPEAHWQNGTIERHGSFLQHMLTKIDMDMPIKSYHDLQLALNQCTQAKNAMIVRHGYSPEIMVFGKQSRLPGSILSDASIPSHVTAVQEEDNTSWMCFRKQLQLREVARQAFHTADNSESLRRALLRRSCPSRGRYDPGQWVMIWRSIGPQKKAWLGPQRTVLQDGDHTVWTTHAGKLYRSAPENVRLALPEEGQPEGPELPEDLTAIQQQIHRMEQNESTLPTIPEHETSNPPEIPEHNSHEIVPEQNRRDSSASESIQQPDQEPETTSQEPQEEQSQNQQREEDPDDELLFLTCHESPCALSENDAAAYGWRCEFEVPISDEFKDHTPSQEEAWIYLATQSKKQRSEVRLSELTTAERQEFESAKQSEVNNWLQTETLGKMFKNQIPSDQILKCRWILTWKPLDNVGDGDDNPNPRTHKAKARIVVLGYMDPKIEEIPRDSPTLGRTSRMMILQVIASHGWSLQSFDIKAAFLQGKPQEGRVIAVEPVMELRKALNMSHHEIGRLNKSAYGLVDAPYLWYCALVQELSRLGMEPCPFDPCVFVLREDAIVPTDDQSEQPAERPRPSGRIVGILGVHVDDGICGGGPKFQKVLDMLERKYPFGSKKSNAFTFTGIEVTQHHDKSITLSQSQYIRKIPSINIDPNRKTQSTLSITDQERGLLRGLIGSLQYASTNTRPDLANRLSCLQTSINQATIETLQEANRLLHEAKKYHDVTITIKPIPHEQFRFMVFSDASFASSNKPHSYAGNIIVGTHQDITENKECPISPISWGSKKIQKVVTSTLSAETVSLASALDQLSWIRLYWKWLHDPSVKWNKPDEALCKVEPAITVASMPSEADLAITDCKSLHDLITRTAPPSCSEFRVQLVARAIKETLREGIRLRWVHTGAQLADCLTKAMEARFLRATLQHGFYRLHDEAAVLRERAKTRDRIQWLKGQNTHSEEPTDLESSLVSMAFQSLSHV